MYSVCRRCATVTTSGSEAYGHTRYRGDRGFGGGVEALSRLVGNLPQNLPMALFAVVHLPQETPSALPRLLTRAGSLQATNPSDGDLIEQGRVYVAPPDFHLQVKDGRINLTRGPKENYHRPAIDPLFRTAALSYGPRVVAAVLSGANGDGTAGLQAVKRCGGVTVVQDPEDALFARMPRNALEYAQIDYCLPLEEISNLLARLAGETPRKGERRTPYVGGNRTRAEDVRARCCHFER